MQVVLETKRGSVSLLQRRLTIGYSRASRLIEAMAAAGIVGDYKGSPGPRGDDHAGGVGSDEGGPAGGRGERDERVKWVDKMTNAKG